MKILLTGGAGFIGSHIVDRYLQLGNQVLIVDDLSTGKKENLNPKAEFFKMDIRSQGVKSLVKQFKPDLINHHAAQINLRKSVEDPLLDAKTNILGLLNLMEAAVKTGSIKKVIFASTGGAIYGDADTIPTPEDYPAWPSSPYGIAKLTGEHYLHYYSQTYKIPYVSLRYGNVYGPRQNPHGEAGVVAIFAKAMLEGKTPTINGNGKQTRDYIFVDDVVEANQIVLKENIKGIFNIGTGVETDVNQIFSNLSKKLGYKKDARHGPSKPGEQQRSALDCTKALHQLHWKPRFSLSEGISKTVEYFKNQ